MTSKKVKEMQNPYPPDKMFLIVVEGKDVWGDEFDRILTALRAEQVPATVYEVNKEDA